MDAERHNPQEIADAEGVPMEVPDGPDEAVEVPGPRVWTDREAVDAFGFIPENVAVRRYGERFPAWR